MGFGRRICIKGGFCCSNEDDEGEQPLFKDGSDYEEFLYLVENCMLEYDFKVHGYCLMPCYYRMIVEAFDESMFEAVSWLNDAYTRFYKERYDYAVIVSTKRFYALPADDEKKFMNVSREVHMEPVKESIVKNPGDYKWSSYNAYVSGRNDGITYRNHIMNHFGNDPKQYQEFVLSKEEE